MGKKLILLMLVVFEFTSCFNQISWRENVESNENTKTSIKKEAEIYISNMFIWDNIKSGRNISAKQRWPDFLSDLNIVNTDGIPIKFNDFTDEEKDIFARKWYESEVEILSEAMEGSEETCRYVERENKIIEQAKLSSYRAVDTIKQNDDFIKSYFKLSKKEYKKIKTKNTGRSISTDSSILSEFDLNIASADYLEQAYKQGYVFISDINVSSGSFLAVMLL